MTWREALHVAFLYAWKQSGDPAAVARALRSYADECDELAAVDAKFMAGELGDDEKTTH